MNSQVLCKLLTQACKISFDKGTGPDFILRYGNNPFLSKTSTPLPTILMSLKNNLLCDLYSIQYSVMNMYHRGDKSLKGMSWKGTSKFRQVLKSTTWKKCEYTCITLHGLFKKN